MLDHSAAVWCREGVDKFLVSHHDIRTMITTRVRGQIKIFSIINLVSLGFICLKSKILP